jgi:hypothetical protein
MDVYCLRIYLGHIYVNQFSINLAHSFNFFFDKIRCDCEFHDSFSFPPGFNELHCSLSICGIPLLILASQKTRCVGKSGGISPEK